MENLMRKKFNEIMNDVKKNGVSSRYVKTVENLSGCYIDFNAHLADFLEMDMLHYFSNKTFLYNEFGKVIGVVYHKQEELFKLNDREFRDRIGECDYYYIDKFIGLIEQMME